MKKLFRAPWVLPVTLEQMIIPDGGVLCEQGRILAVGRFKDLESEADQVIDCDGVLTPALVNGHVHLELSHLAALGRAEEQSCGHLFQWIRRLMAERDKVGAGQHISDSASGAMESLERSGCAAAVDIGNRLSSMDFSDPEQLKRLFFLEFMGISAEAQKKGRDMLESIPESTCCTAHAAYSVGPELMKSLISRSRNMLQPFPIHTAESAEEILFLNNAGGPLRDFLKDAGAWDGSFKAPGCGAVEYLDRLGILDQRTVCVHAVHVSDSEIGLLAEKQSKICLCPGSNRYLGVGSAPVMKFLHHGLLPALGTDSLASNPELNLWREMKILSAENPGVTPRDIFAMATRGGAEAYGLEDDLGTLSAGRKTRFLHISCHGKSVDHVFDFLVNTCDSEDIEWVDDYADAG